MVSICLVRHGETDWNAQGKMQGREDIELNEIGRMQAHTTGRFLSKSTWDRIVTSPLKRAKETASIISAYIGISHIDEVDTLMERDYGAASGLTPSESSLRFPHGNIPGLESMEALRNRSMVALNSIVEGHDQERIIIVAHGGLINAILAIVSDGQVGSGKTVLQNACINLVHFKENVWQIEMYNSVDHFTE